MHLDEKAQLSMDFLGGFVIVFFCLVTVLLFLPSFFSTMQNPSIDLHPVAYRTAVLLAEDVGFWNNGTDGGFNWEDHLNYTSRIGLASLKYGKGDACLLDKDKTLALIKLYNKSDSASYEKVQDLLGLKSSTRKYDYNITFRTLRNNPWLINVTNTQVNMTFGREIPSNGNVEKVVRILKIRQNDFYLDVPSINPPGIDQNWWPDWPAGHIYDSGAPNGQQDRPVQLFTPVYDFTVYNITPIGSNVIKFEMYITNDSSLDRNQNVKAQGELVVDWTMNPGDPWSVQGTAFNGSTWSWNNDSGNYYYDFGSYIQGKISQKGWNGQLIYMTIFVQDMKADVTSSSFTSYTPMSDPWITTITALPSIKMEVCVW